MDSTLKSRKEQFVSGLTGSSILEIYEITLILLLSYLSYCVLNTYTPVFSDGTPFSVVLDYLINWLPLLLSITIYLDHILVLVYGLLFPIVALTVVNYTSKKGKVSAEKYAKNATKSELLPKRPYLTVYRSQMLVITAMAILAVDFKIFPRRYAKCETWGTSLMDLGVGSFVFSMGIVSARSSIWLAYTARKTLFLGKLAILARKIITSVQSSFTVFCLGIGRLVLVKLIGYQEHVSEYGVHWNFFVTLSLLQPAKYLLEFVCSLVGLRSVNVVVGLLILLAHECLLQHNNRAYLAYLIKEERIGIFDENKEGFSSLIGYIAIFLVGEAAGSFLLPVVATPFNLIRNASKKEIDQYYGLEKDDHGSFYKFLRSKLTFSSDVCLVTYAMIFDALAVYCNSRLLFTPVSRRFANFQYVLFVVAYNLNYLVGFKMVGKLFSVLCPGETNVPFSLEAVNRNGLLFFLLSNVLTGLVNMSLNTLDASFAVATACMVVYTAILCFAAMGLHYKGIYVKL